MPQYAPTLDLTTLDGTTGFKISGEADGDRLGYAIASGDVNGDGLIDLIVGAKNADVNGAVSGSVYVILNDGQGFSAASDLATLDGTNGFRIDGEAAIDVFGQSIATGDINNDGFDDIVIGADGAGLGNNGAAYVIFGKASGFTSTLALSSLDGSNGFKIPGEVAGDRLGSGVGVADVNGDGFDDVLMSALASDANGNNSGASYIVLGKASGFGSTFDLATLGSTIGLQINGEFPGDGLGWPITNAGDINGDGVDDMFIGAPFATGPAGASAGTGYIVFGARAPLPASLNLADLNGTNGFQINAEAAGSLTSYSASAAGDINGDGFGDLIISAYASDTNGTDSGATYVIFGTIAWGSGMLDLSALDGTNGFQINGAGAAEYLGVSVSGAGDVNGDGFDDMLVSTKGAANSGIDATYVIFGKATGFGDVFDLTTLDGNTGFRIDAEAASDEGGGYTRAGDVNGDGFDDIMIGAYNAKNNAVSNIATGAAFVVFGGKPSEAVTRTGTDIGQTIHGGDLGDTLLGLAGDDTLIGHAGNDSLDGSFGNDTLTGGDGDDTLIGGAAADTLNGGNGSDIYDVDRFDTIVETGTGIDTLRSSTVSLSLLSHAKIENLTLTGSLGLKGTGSAKANVLVGNSGSNVLLGGGGRDTMTGGGSRDVFDFDKITETGKTAGTRDVITDFKHNVDDIDLRTLDASTKKAGNQAFAFIGTQGFHHQAGELHYLKSGANTIIEGDVNGDGKADFQIGLIGLKTLTSTDFLL